MFVRVLLGNSGGSHVPSAVITCARTYLASTYLGKYGCVWPGEWRGEGTWFPSFLMPRKTATSRLTGLATSTKLRARLPHGVLPLEH